MDCKLNKFFTSCVMTNEIEWIRRNIYNIQCSSSGGKIILFFVSLPIKGDKKSRHKPESRARMTGVKNFAHRVYIFQSFDFNKYCQHLENSVIDLKLCECRARKPFPDQLTSILPALLTSALSRVFYGLHVRGRTGHRIKPSCVYIGFCDAKKQAQDYCGI